MALSIREAIRLLDPKRRSSLFVRAGEFWSAKGDVGKAVADFNKAIRLDPKDPIALQNRAAIWSAKGDFNKAIADCNALIRLDPKDTWAFKKLAEIWYAKGDFDKGIADCNNVEVRLVIRKHRLKGFHEAGGYLEG